MLIAHDGKGTHACAEKAQGREGSAERGPPDTNVECYNLIFRPLFSTKT